MKKIIFLFIFLLVLSSCNVSKNNLPTQITPTIPTESTPLEPTLIIPDDFDEEFHLEEMNLKTLIQIDKIESMSTYLIDDFDDSLVINDIDDFTIYENVNMTRYNKFDNEDDRYNQNYKIVLKDVKNHIRVNVNNDCNFYIGISGYLYYFLNDYYYKSNDSIYYDLTINNLDINMPINQIRTIKSYFKDNIANIKLKFGDKEYDINDLNFINYILDIELCLIGYPVINYSKEDKIDFLSNKSDNGIIITIDTLDIVISESGKLYILKDYIYTTPSINKENYFEIINNYLNNNELVISENKILNDSSKLFDLMPSNITSYDLYVVEGYKNLYKYDTKYDGIKNEEMIKISKFENGLYSSKYLHDLTMVYRSLQVDITGDSFNSFYIGDNGYIYVFFDDCYYKSVNNNFYDYSLDGIIMGYKSCNKVFKLESAIYHEDTNYTDISIIKDNKEIVKIPEEGWKNILIYLSNIEMYLVGCDDYESDQSMTFTDDVLYYHNLIKDSYTIRINYIDNNKTRYDEVYITEDGKILYGYNRLYVSTTIDETDYKQFVDNLITKYQK